MKIEMIFPCFDISKSIVLGRLEDNARMQWMKTFGGNGKQGVIVQGVDLPEICRNRPN